LDAEDLQLPHRCRDFATYHAALIMANFCTSQTSEGELSFNECVLRSSVGTFHLSSVAGVSWHR